MYRQPGTADCTNTIPTAQQLSFEYMGSWMSNSDQQVCSRLASGEHVMLKELSTTCRCKLPHVSLSPMLKPNDVVVQLFDCLIRPCCLLAFHCHRGPSCWSLHKRSVMLFPSLRDSIPCSDFLGKLSDLPFSLLASRWYWSFQWNM
jgi:hypothetical protein